MHLKVLLIVFVNVARSPKHDVGLLIDAEEYNMQLAVDQIVMDLMKEFNTSKAVVYNTVQLYLVDGNVAYNRCTIVQKKSRLILV